MAVIELAALPVIETDALVVGAGPTGLMAGLVLARRGVDVLVIDAKSGPTRESRALAVQARTVEIYDQLGLAEDMLAEAFEARSVQVGDSAAGVVAGLADAQGAATRYPGIHVFEQSRNEELLGEALAARAPVRWNTRLIAILDDGSEPGAQDGPAHAEALAEGPEGLVRIRARWCIGADGAGSAVRHAMGVGFQGVTDHATFYVADLRGVRGVPEETIAIRIGGGSLALLFPMGPGGHARIISMAPGPEVGQDEALAAARSELGITCADVDWFSTYRVHHRVASAFRKGQLFLAGDAAHVHSPVGGQGMNTGLQDAHNLANHLADIALGIAAPAAADAYEAERRPVAKRLVSVTDRLFGLVAGRSRGTARLRRLIAPLAGFAAPRVLASRLGSHVAGLLGQYRIRYGAADRAAVGGADRAVGLRLPEVGANAEALRRLSWQVHTYGAHVDHCDLPTAVDGPLDFGADPQGRLSAERAYLVRPDGFVAASLPVEDGAIGAGALRVALAANDLIPA